MNVFGLDAAGLQVDAWLSGARLLFPLVALAWLALVVRARRAGLLLAGVLLANAWVWTVTNAPLQRPYALGPSSDRLNNMGLCRVVAAEGRPLETIQSGQLHFEPFWGVFVSLLAGGDAERVPRLYPWLSLAVPLAFVLSLWLALRGRPEAGPGSDDSRWEAAVVAGFASLLSSAPLEFLGTYRLPWATMFLLKPNHALALALVPLFLLAFARVRGGLQRVLVGVLLQVVGWVFVIHMAFLVAGLGLFALRSWLARRADRGRELLDVLVVVGVNLLVVSPYLAMLLAGYPFLQPLAVHTLPASSPHLLEGTLQSGWLLPLAFWGFVVLERRGDRMARLWSAQALAAALLWAGCLVLGALQLAREVDEIYQWLRFLTAILAGFGAWDLAARASGLVRSEPVPPAWRAVALSALLVPVALPSWWDPRRMDPFFTPSLSPLPRAIVGPAEYLRALSRPGDVVAGDPFYGNWVAALVGRRVLLAGRFHVPPGHEERVRLERELVTGGDVALAHALAARHRVRFLTVTRPLLAQHGVKLETLKRRADLVLGYEARGPVAGYEPLAVFELRGVGP
jgi:hypothetical protein